MKPEKFYLMTLDPVHIGTGGYRLGRVDNSIVREPGTRVPKIPGTALHGAIRHYAALRFGKSRCAGQKGHCGSPLCPICYTFGSITDNGAKAGVVSISDARIVLFPVYSMFGPVWITTPERLEESGLMDSPPKPDKDKGIWDNNLTDENRINLGWLMIERDPRPFTLNDNSIPQEIKERIVIISERLFTHIVNSNLEVRTSVSINPETGAAEDKALFTYEAIPRATILWLDVVVNDFKGEFPSKERWEKVLDAEGLSRDTEKWQELPETMPENVTPVEKVLKTLGYINSRPQKRENETDEEFQKRKEKYWKGVISGFKTLSEIVQNEDFIWDEPYDVVKFGFEWAEHLGIGGMGTRGFGRVKVLSIKNGGGENDEHRSHSS